MAGFTITRLPTPGTSAHPGTYRVTERLWWTADRSRVVPDGDAEATFILPKMIPMAEAIRLGLVVSPEPVIAEKAIQAPANKARLPRSNKSKGR